MPKRQPDPLSKEEINRIVDVSIEDDYYFTLFTLAKLTGRRLGEYYDLKVNDIDFDKGTIVTKILKRKKRVEKEALLSPDCSRILKQYLIKNKLKLDSYVFRRDSYRSIQRKVKEYAKKAGIKKNVSFHSFRHYFITGLVRSGMSYDQIQKLTGHSSLSTLNIYDHAVASDIKDKALEAMKSL